MRIPVEADHSFHANAHPLRKLAGSRRSLSERTSLRPLPAQRHVFAEWRKARVNIDDHLEVERHHDSVPRALAKNRSTRSARDVPVGMHDQARPNAGVRARIARSTGPS